MVRRKTHEEYIQEVKNLYGDEYIILSKYIKTHANVLAKHNKCGYEYSVIAKSLLEGQGCPKCAKEMKKKIFNEGFNKKSETLLNSGYEILGSYIDSNTNILVKHKTCGYEWYLKPKNIVKDGKPPKCPKCFKRKSNKTTQQFKKEVHDLLNDEYTVLGEYVNNKTKILIKHNACGYEYKTKPTNILSGHGYPKCAIKLKANKRMKTHKEFIEEVYNLVGDEYTVLEEYKGVSTKISIKHNVCGNIYKTTPNTLLVGKRCPKCFGVFKKTTEQFKKEIYEKTNGEYNTLSEYIDSKTKVLIRHNSSDCNNYEWWVNPSSFVNKSLGCPMCSNKSRSLKQRKVLSTFKNEVFDLVGNEYTVLGEYVNGHTKILMRHNCEKCGNYEFYIRPDSFLEGRRCHACKESKGEQRIRKYLTENNYNFKSEYEFEDLFGIGGGLLRYDFIILDKKKNNPIIAIEYDGEQHFKWIKGWIPKERFEELQIHDKLKNEYCENNGIKLIRIPYWDFNNIEKILSEELKLNI